MINELADKLKKYAAEYDLPPFGIEIEGTPKLLLEAADTIEALSAKLQVAKYEQSCSDNDRWVDFNDRLPEDGQKIIISRKGETLGDLFEFSLPDEDCKDDEVVGFVDGWCGIYDGFAVLKDNENKIAWQPLPEPYRPQP